MSNRFDWNQLSQIAANLANGYSLCPKCGTMWLGPETATSCPHCQDAKHPAAVALGSIKSEKKALASRENGKSGGRPKKGTD